jgi:hypothetical protein
MRTVKIKNDTEGAKEIYRQGAPYGLAATD